MKDVKNVKKFLEELAYDSGNILLKYFGKTHQIEKKLNAGIVTEADKASEAFILKKISRFAPGSSIITEESGVIGTEGPWTWVIDPLDGTSNYAHGFPWFCVSIGLYFEGKARAGVIYQPVSKEMFFAEKRKGAYLNGKRMRVSKTTKLEDALLGTGFYYSKDRELQEEMKAFHRFNEKALAVRRPGSAALDLAFVACGRYDGFWERGLSSWDVAAGFLMVEEAGGKFCNYLGKQTDIFEGQVVATNGKIHSEMLRILTMSLPMRGRR